MTNIFRRVAPLAVDSRRRLAELMIFNLMWAIWICCERLYLLWTIWIWICCERFVICCEWFVIRCERFEFDVSDLNLMWAIWIWCERFEFAVSDLNLIWAICNLLWAFGFDVTVVGHRTHLRLVSCEGARFDCWVFGFFLPFFHSRKIFTDHFVTARVDCG